MPTEHIVQFGGETLVLRADRSLWWPSQRILFISDVHAGKARHFALAGLRIPDGSLEADLIRLKTAINELHPGRVIVLGDLFHSDSNNEWQQLVSWRRSISCTFELVRGNHDRFMTDDVLEQGGITVHQEDYDIEPFLLRHHPVQTGTDNGMPVLCGHVHPVFKAFGPGGDRLRLSCFVVQPNQMILPAYGSFTGGYDVARYSFQKLVGCAPDYGSLIVTPARAA